MAAAAVTVMVPAPAVAHHSAVAFDTSRVLKIEGRITQFRWANPHVLIKIHSASAGDNSKGVWTVEMKAPNVLINEGWTRTALRIGDTVTMFVNPLRNPIVLNDGSSGARYVGVVLANGKVLGETDGQGSGARPAENSSYRVLREGAGTPWAAGRETLRTPFNRARAARHADAGSDCSAVSACGSSQWLPDSDQDRQSRMVPDRVRRNIAVHTAWLSADSPPPGATR